MTRRRSLLASSMTLALVLGQNHTVQSWELIPDEDARRRWTEKQEWWAWKLRLLRAGEPLEVSLCD